MQSSGYGNAGQCAMSFLTVVATLTVHRIPAAAALVVAGGFAHLLVWTSLHLPFYHAAFNSIASASYAFMSFLCVGAMISIAVGRNETLLHAWLGMCVLAGCCGAIAPRAQYRRLAKYVACCALLATHRRCLLVLCPLAPGDWPKFARRCCVSCSSTIGTAMTK